MTLNEAVARNLRDLIDSRHINIKHMADELMISRSALYAIMSGAVLPNFFTAWLIAKYFNVTIDSLADGAE